MKADFFQNDLNTVVRLFKTPYTKGLRPFVGLVDDDETVLHGIDLPFDKTMESELAHWLLTRAPSDPDYGHVERFTELYRDALDEEKKANGGPK
jgi:hypothetical protein